MKRLNSALNLRSCVVAIFDLNCNPITYDFAYFLAAAESFAMMRGKLEFTLWIFLRKTPLLEEESYTAVVDSKSLEWRLANIILPLISLYPACRGYSIMDKPLSTKAELGERIAFPEFYDGLFTPNMPYWEIFRLIDENKFRGFISPEQGIKYVELWRQSLGVRGHVVTITLRDYGWDTNRNSNIEAWIKFAETLKLEGFVPIFVPDTESSFKFDQRLANFIVFREACWNLSLRLALYEYAYLNFFVPNGPASIAFLDRKVRCIMMKMLPTESVNANRAVYKDMGLEIGLRKYGFAETYQILSWNDDTFEYINDEFCRYKNSFPPGPMD